MNVRCQSRDGLTNPNLYSLPLPLPCPPPLVHSRCLLSNTTRHHTSTSSFSFHTNSSQSISPTYLRLNLVLYPHSTAQQNRHSLASTARTLTAQTHPTTHLTPHPATVTWPRSSPQLHPSSSPVLRLYLQPLTKDLVSPFLSFLRAAILSLLTVRPTLYRARPCPPPHGVHHYSLGAVYPGACCLWLQR